MSENKSEPPIRTDSPGLRDALRRRQIEATRSLYEDAIQHCKDHLKECGKAECIACRDAKLLMPHYQAEMKKHLQEIK